MIDARTELCRVARDKVVGAITGKLTARLLEVASTVAPYSIVEAYEAGRACGRAEAEAERADAIARAYEAGRAAAGP